MLGNGMVTMTTRLQWGSLAGALTGCRDDDVVKKGGGDGCLPLQYDFVPEVELRANDIDDTES